MMWFWGLYIGINAFRIIISAGECGDCEMTPRGEMLPWDNLCDYHQERLRALSNDAVEDYWRRWYG